MDVKKLRYFLEIAETLNFSKAAENLHMSQPPLTYQLKMLEKELGVTLFKRTTRKVEITAEGEHLKVRARQIINLIESSKSELLQLSKGAQKSIAIGFVASSAALLSPEKLLLFHEKYPEMTFTMKEGSTYKIIDLLNHGIIDIGLVRTPFNAEPYNVRYLPLEEMIAVYDKSAYQFEERITLEDLKSHPLVLDKRFSKMINEACLEAGFTPRIICEGEDSRSILSWTDAGLGVALLPKSGKDFIKNDDLSYSCIQNTSLETRGAIVTLKRGEEKNYIQTLIQMM